MTQDTGTTSLLTIEHLRITRNREPLLDDVSLRVATGSLHVIIGPNGAGKSTLLSAVLGQLPFEGRILLNWVASGTIGYVPQNFPVDPTLPVTVEDFLALTRQRWPVSLGVTASTRAMVARLLDGVGLPAAIRQRPLAVLSGGELRRVLLAHALDPEPELLILDEPTGGLDESSRQWLSDALVTLTQRGRTTVLMVSHDLDHVRRIADRVTLIDRRVIADGVASEVLAAAGRMRSVSDERRSFAR